MTRLLMLYPPQPPHSAVRCPRVWWCVIRRLLAPRHRQNRCRIHSTRKPRTHGAARRVTRPALAAPAKNTSIATARRVNLLFENRALTRLGMGSRGCTPANNCRTNDSTVLILAAAVINGFARSSYNLKCTLRTWLRSNGGRYVPRAKQGKCCCEDGGNGDGIQAHGLSPLLI